MLLWVVSAVFFVGVVFSLIYVSAVAAAGCLYLAILFYKWGRNCYYDLRHDERDDSLLGL